MDGLHALPVVLVVVAGAVARCLLQNDCHAVLVKFPSDFDICPTKVKVFCSVIKISQGCKHLTTKHFFGQDFLDSIMLGPTTTAEFAVISHEKDFFLSEYKGQGGSNTY